MWMSEIKITNFRPFYGQQEIHFKQDSQEKFTIIEAKSDTGKTTFLSAISWCLYGKDLGDVHKDNIHPFNLDKKDELMEGDYDDMEVMITLNDDGSSFPRYVITRKSTCVKRGDFMEYESEPSIRIEEWQNHEARPISDSNICKRLINAILPEDIHMFFLFEGEKLEKHFSFYSQENIQAAIEKISQIEQMKSAIKHMIKSRERVYNEKNKEGDHGESNENQKKLDKYGGDIDSLKKQKIKSESQLADAKSEIKRIDEKLTNVNLPLINKWAEDRVKLEKTNKELEGDLKLIRSELTDSLLKNVPLAICSKAHKNLLDHIKKSEQNNELPPKIKNIYVRELLEKKSCICGRSLDSTNENSRDAIKQLNQILEQNDLSDLAEILIEGRYAIKDILEDLPQDITSWRDSKLHEVNEINKAISSNIVDIDEISENLQENNREEIATLDYERSEYVAASDIQTRSIAQIDVNIKSLNDEILHLRRRNDKLAKNKENYRKMKKVADFMDRSLDILEKMKDDILEEVRLTVQNNTFKSFMDLHWDKTNYETFVIDTEYNMSLKDPQGNERIYNIASGTKQVLLLSFIAALAEVSGFKFPIFIDTPLANTDNSQRLNIATNFPNYLKQNQVVLLVKDQEYTPKFRESISECVSQELKMVKVGGKTEVRPWA